MNLKKRCGTLANGPRKEEAETPAEKVKTDDISSTKTKTVETLDFPNLDAY